jgi:hypothetical protein
MFRLRPYVTAKPAIPSEKNEIRKQKKLQRYKSCSLNNLNKAGRIVHMTLDGK